jgi:hypothetical protein
MIDEFPRETARDRAARIWHNGQVQKRLIKHNQATKDEDQKQIDEINEEEKRLHQFAAKFRKEVRNIINEKQYKSFYLYLAYLKMKRQRLLRAKLAALEKQYE